MELLAWSGAICFALCAVPQVVQTIRDGHAKGLAPSFLAMWFYGEIVMITYTLPRWETNQQVMANYLLNFICLCVMIYYKIWPRKKNE